MMIHGRRYGSQFSQRVAHAFHLSTEGRDVYTDAGFLVLQITCVALKNGEVVFRGTERID